MKLSVERITSLRDYVDCMKSLSEPGDDESLDAAVIEMLIDQHQNSPIPKLLDVLNQIINAYSNSRNGGSEGAFELENAVHDAKGLLKDIDNQC